MNIRQVYIRGAQLRRPVRNTSCGTHPSALRIVRGRDFPLRLCPICERVPWAAVSGLGDLVRTEADAVFDGTPIAVVGAARRVHGLDGRGVRLVVIVM
jgi:hypothetical protein